MYSNYTDEEMIKAASLATNPIIKDLIRRIMRQKKQLKLINGMIEQINHIIKGGK